MTDLGFVLICIIILLCLVIREMSKNLKRSNDTNELEMYPYCDVYYKTDTTPGWNMAQFPGTKEEVEEQCKAFSDWIKFDVWEAGKCIEQTTPQLNYHRPAFDLYLCTDTIYSPELDKYFLDRDDEMPYPNTTAPIIESISFNYSFDIDNDEFWCDNNPTDFIDDKEEIFIDAYMGIVLPEKEIGINLQIENEYIYKEFEQYIDKIKQGKYAVFNVYEYSKYKFLTWVKNDKVRFMIQDYFSSNDEYITILLDVLIDKEQFITNIEKMYNRFKKDSTTFMLNFKQEVQELRQQNGIR